MKLSVYMAISIDGLIARGVDDTSWVSDTDWAEFNKFIDENDAIIMGRKTMDNCSDFPLGKKTMNIVLSNNNELHKEVDRLIIMSGSPNEVIEIAKSRNYEKLFLIGGANTNAQFLKAKLVDEVIVSVHPLIIGNGLRLFGVEPLDINLQILVSRIISNELVQIRYRCDY